MWAQVEPGHFRKVGAPLKLNVKLIEKMAVTKVGGPEFLRSWRGRIPWVEYGGCAYDCCCVYVQENEGVEATVATLSNALIDAGLKTIADTLVS